MIDMKLEGVNDVEKYLTSVERKTARSIVRKAATKGVNVFKKQIRSNAITMVGGQMGALISKNVATGTLRSRGRYTGHGRWIGMRPKVREFEHIAKGKSIYKGKRTYIPSAIEYGHISSWFGHYTGGVTRPIPFMRRAFESYKKKAVQEFTRKLKEQIEMI
jgi:hypothetical protein